MNLKKKFEVEPNSLKIRFGIQIRVLSQHYIKRNDDEPTRTLEFVRNYFLFFSKVRVGLQTQILV